MDLSILFPSFEQCSIFCCFLFLTRRSFKFADGLVILWLLYCFYFCWPWASFQAHLHPHADTFLWRPIWLERQVYFEFCLLRFFFKVTSAVFNLQVYTSHFRKSKSFADKDFAPLCFKFHSLQCEETFIPEYGLQGLFFTNYGKKLCFREEKRKFSVGSSISLSGIPQFSILLMDTYLHNKHPLDFFNSNNYLEVKISKTFSIYNDSASKLAYVKIAICHIDKEPIRCF